jgi:hypothetical protein
MMGCGDQIQLRNLIAIIHQYHFSGSRDDTFHNLDDGIKASDNIRVADQFRATLRQVTDVAGTGTYTNDHACFFLLIQV